MAIVTILLLGFIVYLALSRWQRIDVLKRDNFECVECDRTWEDGYMLEVHHIEPSHMGGTDEQENLETRCRPCHEQAHLDIDDKHSANLIADRIKRKGIRRYGK